MDNGASFKQPHQNLRARRGAMPQAEAVEACSTAFPGTSSRGGRILRKVSGRRTSSSIAFPQDSPHGFARLITSAQL